MLEIHSFTHSLTHSLSLSLPLSLSLSRSLFEPLAVGMPTFTTPRLRLRSVSGAEKPVTELPCPLSPPPKKEAVRLVMFSLGMLACQHSTANT